MIAPASRTPRAGAGRKGTSPRPGRSVARAALALIAVAAASRAVAAEDAAPAAGVVAEAPRAPAVPGALWFSLGLLAGSEQPDAKLADYQWDTSLKPAWGVQALAGRGALALGARVWSTQTTQRIDLPGTAVEPRVGLTSLELVGMGRVATLGSGELLVTGCLGGLHLGYHPDQITIPVPGPGVPIIAQFAPVDEWTGGGGLAIRSGFGARWSLGLGVEREFFGLDTAHQSGGSVVYGHESLGDWSARLEIARRFQHP